MTALPMFLIPQVLAETVTNDISVFSSSGGNSADGGIIKTGTSKARIYLETVINGETVELIDKEIESSGENGAFLEEETHYESEDGSVETKTFIRAEAGETVIGNNGEQEKLQQEIAEENNIEETEDEGKSFIGMFFKKLFNYVYSIFK